MQPAHSSRGGRRSQRVPSSSAGYRVHGPRFAAPGSADRSRPPERSAQAAGRRVREPRRPLAPRRVDTTADAGETATPPARAPERDGDRRTSSSSSRPRTRHRSARSPTSRCPRVRATAASAATATPPPEAAQAHAGPRPRSELPRGCARRATANGGRRARARVRGREWRRPPRAPPRSRRKRQQQGGAARRRRDSGSRQPLVLLAARVVQAGTSPHAVCVQPAPHCRDVPTASGRTKPRPLKRRRASGKSLARVVWKDASDTSRQGDD